ncbi:MAG: HD domain-containing phosphohydrolase [Betaproteobacteria bacterium]
MTGDLHAPLGSLSTVLCVDDEPNVLAALNRALRGAGFCVMSAQSGAQAIAMLEQIPVDLVISDMRMPNMDGAALLEQVRLRWPQIVRILLTGHADSESTIAAINRAQVLRYLCKPWTEHELLSAVQQGLQMSMLDRERVRLQALAATQNEALLALNADLERRVSARTSELGDALAKLQRRHVQSVKVFADLIEMRSGSMSGHGRRVAQRARDLARALGLEESAVFDVFVAALLHDIGLIGTDDGVLMRSPTTYGASELADYHAHPGRGAQLLVALDDMQPVMRIIEAHHEHVDGSGFPAGRVGDDIPIGARIIAVADAVDALESGLLSPAGVQGQGAELLRQGAGSLFDPRVVQAWHALTSSAAAVDAGTPDQESPTTPA